MLKITKITFKDSNTPTCYITNEQGDFLKVYPEVKFIKSLYGVWSTVCLEQAENMLLSMAKTISF